MLSAAALEDVRFYIQTDPAIDRYKTAWQKAQDALKKI